MHTPHNKTYLFVHIIWSVKSRVPLLKKEIRKVLFPHIKQNAERNETKILIINGIEDYVHCLLQMHPSQNLSQIIKSIKGESSHWINENNFLAETFQWQDGYAAYSVSPSAVDKVLDYIYNQEEHHKKRFLEEELEVLDKIKIRV
jgi:putative transposase